jgi:hypothetical protein
MRGEIRIVNGPNDDLNRLQSREFLLHKDERHMRFKAIKEGDRAVVDL